MFQQLFYVLLATYLDDDLLNGKSVNSRNIGFKGSLFKAINILSSGKSQQPDSFPLDGCLMLEEQCKLPAPLISMDSSDELCITLISGNTSLEPETFHIHRGQEVLDLKKVEPGSSKKHITFLFKAPSPGTYYYHCHREGELPYVGTCGALVVYPTYQSLVKRPGSSWLTGREKQCHIPRTATNRNFAYNDGTTYFKSEWTILFSEAIPAPDAEPKSEHGVKSETNKELDLTNEQDSASDPETNTQTGNYAQERSFFINGRSFPVTLSASSATEGYETYKIVTGGKADGTVMPEIFLVRLVNQCNSTIPFSIHEMKGTIVARNGLLIGQDNRKVYDTINIDPGESCDVLYKAQTAEVDIPAYGWRFKQKQDMIETGQQLTNAMIKELRSLTTKLPSQERLSRWMKYVFDGRPNVCNNALAKLYKINFAGNLKELNKLSKDQEPTGQLVVLETQFDTFKSRLGRTPGGLFNNFRNMFGGMKKSRKRSSRFKTNFWGSMFNRFNKKQGAFWARNENQMQGLVLKVPPNTDQHSMSRITRTIRRCINRTFKKNRKLGLIPPVTFFLILTNCLIMHQTGTKDKRIDIVEKPDV